MEKSANKRWKESGTTLTFKEFITRENEKQKPVLASFDGSGMEMSMNINVDPSGFLNVSGENVDVGPPISNVQEIINKPISDTLAKSEQAINKSASYSTVSTSGKTLGLDNRVLAFSGIMIVGSIGVYLYKRLKK